MTSSLSLCFCPTASYGRRTAQKLVTRASPSLDNDLTIVSTGFSPTCSRCLSTRTLMARKSRRAAWRAKAASSPRPHLRRRRRQSRARTKIDATRTKTGTRSTPSATVIEANATVIEASAEAAAARATAAAAAIAAATRVVRRGRRVAMPASRASTRRPCGRQRARRSPRSRRRCRRAGPNTSTPAVGPTGASHDMLPLLRCSHREAVVVVGFIRQRTSRSGRVRAPKRRAAPRRPTTSPRPNAVVTNTLAPRVCHLSLCLLSLVFRKLIFTINCAGRSKKSSTSRSHSRSKARTPTNVVRLSDAQVRSSMCRRLP